MAHPRPAAPLSSLTLGALRSIVAKDWASVVKTDKEGRDILRAIEASTKSDPGSAKDVATLMFEEYQDAHQEGQDTPADEQPEQDTQESPAEAQEAPDASQEGEGEDESNEEEGDEEGESDGKGGEPPRFDLEEFVVEVATRRREEILHGMDFGHGNHSIPNVPTIPFTPAAGANGSLKRTHDTFPLLLTATRTRRPIMLVGPAGGGKTTAGAQLAEAYGVPFHANSNSIADTRYLAFGMVDAGGNYKPGYMYEPMKHGGVLLDDELDAGNPSVLVAKNTAIENRWAQFPNGEMVRAHPDFIYVGSANTFGRGADRIYVGRTPIDGASHNRFIWINWDYDEALELAISANEKWTKWVQRVRKVVFDHKMRYVVSPRQSIAGGELLALGIPERTVRQMTVFPGWAPADVDRVMREVV
jgi:hypothetical protein